MAEHDLDELSVTFSGDVVSMYAGKKLSGFAYVPHYYLELTISATANNVLADSANPIRLSVSQEIYRKVESLLSDSKAESPILRLKKGKLEIVADAICAN